MVFRVSEIKCDKPNPGNVFNHYLSVCLASYLSIRSAGKIARMKEKKENELSIHILLFVHYYLITKN